ncbi:sulfotransferase [Verrucomicrobiales bacterium]|nr:sulfotransferase [Verrucomicrobiales bacterium]
MSLPNFFIAGAAKCGTTALYHCLREHPEVFLPHSKESYWLHKEPNYFCSDLGIADWLRYSDQDSYERIFDAAGEAKRIGDATPWYLYSPEAPARIAANCGKGSKVIIMLRPPVGWMRSFHHDMLRWGYEDEGDFGKALDLCDARESGEQLPKRPAFAKCLNYRNAARFTEQVELYYKTFG